MGMDLFLDNVKMNDSTVNYTQSVKYFSVDQGVRNIKLVEIGTSNVFMNHDLPMISDESYSVYAVSNNSNIEFLDVEDDLTAPEAGTARLRFIQLSSDLLPVDFCLNGDSVVFQDITFKEYTDFITFPSGNINFELRYQGTPSIAMDIDSVFMEPGKIYTLFVRGSVSGTGNQVLSHQVVVNKE
jgi:hypothetical protein